MPIFEQTYFLSYFTKYLKRPWISTKAYYDDREIKLCMDVIPATVTRISIRFLVLDDGNLKRTLPISFQHAGRTFKLHSLAVYNKEKSLFLCGIKCKLSCVDHAFNMFVKWKGESHTCWLMTGIGQPPVNCSGENEGKCTKDDCTRNRVVFAGYVVRDPSMDP